MLKCLQMYVICLFAAIIAGNVQIMKLVQFCTRFIFCKFSAIVLTQRLYNTSISDLVVVNSNCQATLRDNSCFRWNLLQPGIL